MMHRVPMIWAVLALFSCAVGPVYALPDMALPDRYARLEPVSRASAADMQWWQHFNDPLLTQLVDRAVAGNTGLAETRAPLAEVGVAYVDLRFEQASLALRQRTLGDIRRLLDGGDPGGSLMAGLTMPLFNQPGLAASVDAADAADARVNQAYLRWQRAVLATVEEVENAQGSLQASVAAQAEAARLVALNRQALDLSRQLLTNRGTITVLDMLDRERALSQARACPARSQRDQAIDSIVLPTVIEQGHSLDAQ